MKKCILSMLAILSVLIISGCSNDYGFHPGSDTITFTYGDNEYVCVSQDACVFAYSEKNMVFLDTLRQGEFADMAPSYNVYRHADDEALTYLFIIPKPSIRDMTPYAFIMKVKDAPTKTFAPGDFTFQSIIDGAERHMPGLSFSDIPADELKKLYPDVVALPIEVRGRWAADGTEYLVLAAMDASDLDKIPNVKAVLESAAEARANTLSMESEIIAGGYNKYGTIICAKKDTKELLSVLENTFSGQYITN